MINVKNHKTLAEAKLASIAWKLKMIQTSVKVTHTPRTTLKSLILGVVKEEGPTYVGKLEKCVVMVDSALGNSDPLVKKDRGPLPHRIY